VKVMTKTSETDNLRDVVEPMVEKAIALTGNADLTAIEAATIMAERGDPQAIELLKYLFCEPEDCATDETAEAFLEHVIRECGYDIDEQGRVTKSEKAG